MSHNHNMDRIRILQWNLHGVRAKLPLLHLALSEERYDITLLQETLLTSNIRLPQYIGFHKLYKPGENRGISIFVRRDSYAESITLRNNCGREIEVIGASVTLNNFTLSIYNIYRPPQPRQHFFLNVQFTNYSGW